MYTLETLLEGNETYNLYHRLLEKDVQKVNDLVTRIEASRAEQTTPAPLDGDIVHCFHPTSGHITNGGHLDLRGDGDRIEICVYPYVPFIGEITTDNSLYTNASGGPWYHFMKDDFLMRGTYEDRKPKVFKVWGHMGACADGTIRFSAQVNVWKLTDQHFYKHNF